MSVAEFIYDRAPKVVQNWMDRTGLTPDAIVEAAAIWGDRRKYNIEHNIPLTTEQQRQQDKIESVGIPLSRAEKPIPNPTIDRNMDQRRLSIKL